MTKKLFFCTNVFKWKIFSEGSKQFLTLYFNFESFIACMYTKKEEKILLNTHKKINLKNALKKCKLRVIIAWVRYFCQPNIKFHNQIDATAHFISALCLKRRLFHFLMPSNEVSTPTRGLNENLLFRTHWVTFIKVGLCNFGDAFAVQH